MIYIGSFDIIVKTWIYIQTTDARNKKFVKRYDTQKKLKHTMNKKKDIQYKVNSFLLISLLTMNEMDTTERT